MSEPEPQAYGQGCSVGGRKCDIPDTLHTEAGVSQESLSRPGVQSPPVAGLCGHGGHGEGCSARRADTWQWWKGCQGLSTQASGLVGARKSREAQPCPEPHPAHQSFSQRKAAGSSPQPKLWCGLCPPCTVGTVWSSMEMLFMAAPGHSSVPVELLTREPAHRPAYGKGQGEW